MGMTTRFTDHPASVGESYTEHFGVAFRISRQLAGASAQALVHAFLPWCCSSSASDRIKDLNRLVTSGARGQVAAEREAVARADDREPVTASLRQAG